MLTSPFPKGDDDGGSAHKVLGSGWTAPRRARAFVRAQLGRWGLPDLVETAELLVSELVTNAVRATNAVSSPPIVSSMFPVTLRSVAVRLRLSARSRSLFIEVWDASASVPVPRRDVGPGDEGLEEGGRGLELVDGLARRWGHHTARDRGKIVWCELAASPEISPLALHHPPPASPGVADPAIATPIAPVRAVPVPVGSVSPAGSPPPALAVPVHMLPRRVRNHPRAERAEGPDRDTLLRVLQGLRDLD
ncbi:ATP-binding protein [Sphaerimonospora cavernae]|uniref:ATP-binding protein n=1 Tax=Sphaerimonospora cavernae TaxID=1740611 RepID=A0ABV6UD87_9ACTN